jgi:hypothetical protein
MVCQFEQVSYLEALETEIPMLNVCLTDLVTLQLGAEERIYLHVVIISNVFKPQ